MPLLLELLLELLELLLDDDGRYAGNRARFRSGTPELPLSLPSPLQGGNGGPLARISCGDPGSEAAPADSDVGDDGDPDASDAPDKSPQLHNQGMMHGGGRDLIAG